MRARAKVVPTRLVVLAILLSGLAWLPELVDLSACPARRPGPTTLSAGDASRDQRMCDRFQPGALGDVVGAPEKPQHQPAPERRLSGDRTGSGGLALDRVAFRQSRCPGHGSARLGRNLPLKLGGADPDSATDLSC